MTEPGHHIHLFGASGSGTTTLGAALAEAIGGQHLDTDSYYWEDTEPPFTTKRPIEQRIRDIQRDSKRSQHWTLSGSLCSWGDPLLESFTLAVFVRLDPAVRLERLRARERERYGSRISPDGDMFEQHRAFIEWAASYDTAEPPIRSLKMHQQWQTTLPCPVVTVNSGNALDANLTQVLKQLGP